MRFDNTTVDQISVDTPIKTVLKFVGANAVMGVVVFTAMMLLIGCKSDSRYQALLQNRIVNQK
jgi:hypothetical protein